MSEAPGIWFFYRSHYEGPLSRRLTRVEAPSVLEWFSRHIATAQESESRTDLYEPELGGYVYGLRSLFEATRCHTLEAPESVEALERLLREHLYVEGGDDHIRVDDHTVRILTDDDEVSLAYYFFDDEIVRTNPDRVSWLLHGELCLPDVDVDDQGDKSVFTPPFSPAVMGPSGDGEGTTYACFLTFHDGDSIPGKVVALPGVRLPDLASHLRSVVPAKKPSSWSKEYLDTWPVELRLLRAMIEPGQLAITPALSKCAAYPLRAVAGETNHTLLGVGAHQSAYDEFYKVGTAFKHGGDPSRSIVRMGKHAVLFCPHTSSAFGYEQWILFDDRFASANPALAASILRYANSWDPFVDPEPPKIVEDEAVQKERAWKDAIGIRLASEAAPYRTTEKFVKDQLISHAKFGIGVVRRVEGGKFEVVFKDGPRLLAHGMQPTQT